MRSPASGPAQDVGRAAPGAPAPGEHDAARAARVRPGMEWLLRALVVGLLVWYLAQSLGAGGRQTEEQARSDELASALERWSTQSAPASVRVALDHPPAVRERDWLAALAGAGTEVRWSGPSLLPTAVVMEPRADPAGGADVSVSAPAGAVVAIRDTLGTLDSASAGAAGVRARLPRPRSTVDAVVGPVVARAALHDSLELRRLLVIGAASWETKFVTAALEERGWRVDAHVVVSPKGDVRQGDIGPIDTARYSAVLAMDTTAARYGERIVRYVRDGGGLVLWAPAARSRAFASVAPAAGEGELVDDTGRVPSDSAPRNELELVPLARLADDAVVLERRGSAVALAARRVGAGRVLQNGYTNSWRWRMAGGDDAPEAHRTWLAGAVAQVAYVGRRPLEAPPTAVAPLATLVDRLGSPADPPAVEASHDPEGALGWVFALILLSLIAEWASRRLRGAR